MQAALLDSNVIIYARNSDSGERHERSLEIVKRIDRGELPTAHVTDYVVAETLNLMHSRDAHRLGEETYDLLYDSAGFEIRHTAKSDFTEGVRLYRRHEKLSFVDCILAAYMDRVGLEYIYTMDGEFDRLDWVTRLSTADNPFS